MAIAASLANPTILSDSASVAHSEPTALIAAALKYNKLSIDEGFTAFDQVNCRILQIHNQTLEIVYDTICT